MNANAFGTLVYCIRTDNDSYVKKTIKEHPDVINMFSSTHGTLLHRAIDHRAVKVMRVLIDAGADVNMRDVSGFSPVVSMWTKKDSFKHVDQTEVMCEMLVKAEANVNVSDADGMTPLHYACKTSSLSLVRLLLFKNADVKAKTLKGETPLMLADSHFALLDSDRYLALVEDLKRFDC